MINKDYKIDSNSLGEFLDLGVVTSPKTIFKDFYKVNPAEFLIFDLNNYRIKSQNKYWNIDEKIDSQKFDSNTFFNLFSDSIQSREVADVEIATYLSGGIDSSSIIKNMKDRNVESEFFRNLSRQKI